MLFIIAKGKFLSDDHWARKFLAKHGLIKGENEDDFVFRKRSFLKLWELTGDLMEAIEFLFGPYKMTEEWTGMENQKRIAANLMTEVRDHEGDPEEIMKAIERYLPSDPLLVED
jgi:hypothetical protein